MCAALGFEFRVLGPVEIWAGDTALPAAEPRQRLLLAALAADAGRPVPTGVLIERVWGDDAPEQARRTLQAHVSRLRRTLSALPATPAPAPATDGAGGAGGAGGGEPRLARSSGGYCLDVPADQVDLLRFRALVAGARDERDTLTRVTALREALGLWRGEPLTGLDGAWVERVRHSWGLERISAQLTWAAAELEAGEPDTVLGPLTELLHENPLLESGAALLMRALAATGRTAEAMDRFDAVRRRLREELGCDPGPDLQAAHRDLLRVAGPPRAVRPAQLPADVPMFTGRDTELRTLQALLPDGGRPAELTVAVIAGTAGVGKTALAVRWAHRVQDRYPDGQLYVNLRGYDPEQPLTAAEALEGFLGALLPPSAPVPPRLADRAARFRSELAGRRMLVVLDNAATEEQVRPLLPGSPGCLVVVTSRDSLAGLVARDGARRLTLDLLPAADATALLNRLVGERSAADPPSTAELTELCARLPLALRVAAELAVARPQASLAELVHELSDQQRRLDLLSSGGDQRVAARAVFSWSVRQLPPGAARTFALLGLHPGPEFDAHAAAALAGGALDDARDALDVLARSHLVQPAGPRRYVMHDLLKAYAGHLAATPGVQPLIPNLVVGEARPALQRLFDHYLATAAAAMDRLYPAEKLRRSPPPAVTTPVPEFRQPEQAREWLESERTTLLAVAAHGAAHGWPHHTMGLSTTLFRYLDGRRQTDRLTLHGAALDAARRIGDLAGEALAENCVGTVHIQAGEHEVAVSHLSRALGLFLRVGDLSGQARALGNLGCVEEKRAGFTAAADYYCRSMELFTQLGDTAGQAHVMTRLGAVEQRLGRYHRASLHLAEALLLHRRTGHRFGEAWALTGLGDVETAVGRHEEAIRQHREAITLFRQLGDPEGEAWALTGAGTAELRAGRPRSAVRHHEQALLMFSDIGEPDGEAWALNGLGEVAREEGRPADAVRHHRQALVTAGEAGARDQEARACSGLAAAWDALGETERADGYLARALAIYDGLQMRDVWQHLAVRPAARPRYPA